MPEYLAKLTPEERERTATKAGRSWDADDTAQTWPSRAAMLTTLRMQSSGPSRPDHWRPLVKP
jgi:hypothetical protein